MTKDEAIEFARQYGWTQADAKRAFADVDFKTAQTQDIFLALIQFAGTELITRQRSQAGFKGAVTKKSNEIAALAQEFHDHIIETEARFEEMQSRFIPVIEKIYFFAKPFGLKDPWIEAMLKLYNERNKDNNSKVA